MYIIRFRGEKAPMNDATLTECFCLNFSLPFLSFIGDFAYQPSLICIPYQFIIVLSVYMASKRDILELKKEVVRSVTYRESLIMQLNALVLNWPASASDPHEKASLDHSKKLLGKVSILYMPYSVRIWHLF